MRIRSDKTWQKHVPGKLRRRPARHYYSQLKSRQTINVKRIIWLIVVVLLVQAVFQAKFFRLDNFSISGNQDISLADIQATIDKNLGQGRYLIFKNSNYFLFDRNNLEQELLESFNLDEIKVDKKFPHTLEISLQEKISQFIWQRDDTLYLLSAQGALNRQINGLDEKYLILADQRSWSPEDDKILRPNELEAINKLYLSWTNIFKDDPKLTKVILTDDLGTIRAQTKIGFYVLVDLTKDIDEQLKNLNKVLAGDIIGQDIDYIDLRFGDRVFFK